MTTYCKSNDSGRSLLQPHSFRIVAEAGIIIV